MSDIGILGGDLSALPSLAGAANGWASGARALVGANTTGQNAYMTGQLRGAQSASALELARERRDKNLALASITPEALADPAQHGALQAAAIRGGVNLDQVERGLRTRQEAVQQQSIYDDAAGGTPLGQLQARLAALKGEPLKLTAVEGNTIIDPYADPNGQAAVGGNNPTAVGLGDIAAANARATASLAAAGASNASAKRQLAGIGADKASNYEIAQDDQGNLVRINKLDPTDAQPVTIGGAALHGAAKGGAGKNGPTLPAPSALKQVFGEDKIGGGPNDKATQFLTWQALQAQTDPRFNNGDYALQQYVLHQSGASQAEDQTAGNADALGLGTVATNATGNGQPVKAMVTPKNGGVIVGPSSSVSTLDLASAARQGAGGGGDGSPVILPGGGVASPQAAIQSAKPPVITKAQMATLPRPQNEKEYDALPPGPYIYTDGTVQIKGGG